MTFTISFSAKHTMIGEGGDRTSMQPITAGFGAWFEFEPWTADNGAAWLTLTARVPFGRLARQIEIQIPPKIIAQLARAMQAETIVAGEVMIRTDTMAEVVIRDVDGTDSVLVLDDGGLTRVSPTLLTRPRTMADSPMTARAPREASQVVGAVSGAPVPQTVAAPDTTSQGGAL